MMATLPYENSTAGQKAMAEIQTILQKFGCSKFGTMLDFDAGTLVVQFEWNGQKVSFPANFKGYAARWLEENPHSSRRQSTLAQWEKKALEIGSMAVYSILRDWIKAQLVAVETGLVKFDEVFLAHLLLPNGKRVIEHAQATNLLSKD
jgi:hypothetical protein